MVTLVTSRVGRGVPTDTHYSTVGVGSCEPTTGEFWTHRSLRPVESVLTVKKREGESPIETEEVHEVDTLTNNNQPNKLNNGIPVSLLNHQEESSVV